MLHYVADPNMITKPKAYLTPFGKWTPYAAHNHTKRTKKRAVEHKNYQKIDHKKRRGPPDNIEKYCDVNGHNNKMQPETFSINLLFFYWAIFAICVEG